MKRVLLFLCFWGISDANAQKLGENLPFPLPPSRSVANETMQESKNIKTPQPNYLPENAPNILIIMLDDIGFGTAETFGGAIHTPSLTKLANAGIAYNRFHTAAVCSPTRASLITGRNPHKIGFGTIAERANDWEGYRGIIPKSAATLAAVLREYGYNTSHFGKWHNTPVAHTTAMGPFHLWPSGYGIDYFYGFMAGETSQYEPRLFENNNPVEPGKKTEYHLTSDMTDKALVYLERQKSYAPEKPFLMYWTPGAVHGPHHVAKKWADKYKGKFDAGWDEYRKTTFEKQKALGWIPENTILTERASTLASWNDIPKEQKAFQSRLMEVFAGFVEHTDYEMGRLIDGIEKLGELDNTIVMVIWGDNGSSMEGQTGSISELLAQNLLNSDTEEQLKILNSLGGLDVLGTDKTDNIYHAAWAWAGNTPFKHAKTIASHFGGSRNPLVISWPKNIKADKTPRSQFYHVNDIVPTIYDILKIEAPKTLNGVEQMPIDGVSMAATFNNVNAENNKSKQYFDVNGSRGIYKEEWFASAFGPIVPWQKGDRVDRNWNPKNDVWELYNLKEDFSQSHDLAKENPVKLEELKSAFLEEAKANKVFPIGGAMLARLDPKGASKSKYSHWDFTQNTQRMPELTAPGLGKTNNEINIEVELNGKNNGVIYALGGNSGGICLFMKNGVLYYEYNKLIIERFKGNSKKALAKGKHTIKINTQLTEAKPTSPATIKVSVDDVEVFAVNVSKTVPLLFTASETFDVGKDLGSPVALDYHHLAPFKFDGKINKFSVDLK